MKNLIGKIAILAILSFGIFFVASDKASASAVPSCQQCVEMDSECVLYCEAGQNAPGCSWCIKKAQQCWSICKR